MIAKNIFFGIMVVIWILVCGEISVRIISTVTQISNIEWLKYTNTLHAKSLNPNLRYIHKANSSAHLMGVELNFSSLGHRNEDLKSPKGEKEKRMYFAGNSLLLAWGVPQKDSYTNVLQKRFQEEMGNNTGAHYLSINAGVGGYTTSDQVELFADQISATHPDLVILQYFINDAEDKSGGANNIIFKYSLLAATAHSFYHSIFFEATGSLEEYYSKMYGEESIGWKKAKASIKKLRGICKDKNIPLIALFVPDFHNLSSEDPYPLIYDKIQRAFDEAEIPMLNTLPVLQKEFAANPREAWISTDDAHPNIETHKIIADELFDFINNLKINEF